MKAVKNQRTGTWHLLGIRGCGAEPDGEPIDDTWAAIRDRVERDPGDRCQNCNWPSG